MKITQRMIKNFKMKQQANGTEVALNNFLWVVGEDIMRQSKKENFEIRMTYPVKRNKIKR